VSAVHPSPHWNPLVGYFPVERLDASSTYNNREEAICMVVNTLVVYVLQIKFLIKYVSYIKDDVVLNLSINKKNIQTLFT